MLQPSDDEEYILQVSNIPQGYHLLKLGISLENYIGVENAITSISWEKPPSEKQLLCNVEVKFQNSQDLEALLKQKKIDINFNHRSYSIIITKPRKKNLLKAITIRPAINEGNGMETVNYLSHAEASNSEKTNASENHSNISLIEETKANILQHDNIYEVEIDSPFYSRILEYMRNSKDLLEKLNDYFDGQISVSRYCKSQSASYVLSFCSILDKVDTKTLKNFCDKQMENFFTDYLTQTFQCSTDEVTYLLQKSDLTDPDYWKSRGLYPVFFESNVGDDWGIIIITGEKNAVEKVMIELEHFSKVFLEEKSSVLTATNDSNGKHLPVMQDFEIRPRSCVIEINLPNVLKIVEYLKTSDFAMKMLNNFCKDSISITRVDSNDSPSSYGLQFRSLSEKINSMSQSTFKSYCTNIVEKFSDKFSTSQCTSSRMIMEQLKKKHQLSDHTTLKIAGKSYDLYLEWKLTNNLTCVFVTGETIAVKHFVDSFNQFALVMSTEEQVTATSSDSKQGKHLMQDSEIKPRSCEIEMNLPNVLNIVEYLKTSDFAMKILNNFCEDIFSITRVDSNNSPSSYGLQFTSLSEKINSMSQSKFNSYCTNIVDKFLGKFSTSQCTSSRTIMEQLKKKHQLSDHTTLNIGGTSYNLYLEWKLTNNPSCVFVTGKTIAVKHFVDSFNQFALVMSTEVQVTATSSDSIQGKHLMQDSDIKSRSCEIEMNLPNVLKIVEYLKTSDLAMKILSNFCEDLVSVTRVDSNNSPSSYGLQFTSLSETINSMSSSTFKSYCTNILDKFLDKFSTSQCTSSRKIMEQLKKKHQLSDYTILNIAGKSYDLYLEWKLTNDQSCVFVTGESIAVEDFIKSFNEFALLMSTEEQVTATSSDSKQDIEPDYDIHKKQDWNKLLGTEPELFTNFNQKSVLVRNLPTDCDFAEVRDAFETQIKGKVKRIVRLLDGYLIVFRDKSSVKSALDCDEFSINESEMTISEKHIPVADDRLLGVKGKLSCEYVSTILNSCSAVETDFEVLQVSEKKFLVVFQNGLSDLARLKNEFNNKKLRDLKFTTTTLCHSDRVVVKKAENLSPDMVKLALLRKQYVVTYVSSPSKSGDILVFLSDYRNVPKLLEEEIEVDNTRLEIFYYLPGFSQITKDQYRSLAKASISVKTESKPTKKFQPKPYQQYFGADDDLTTLILNSKLSHDDLSDKLIGLAQVEMKQKNLGLECTFTPVASQRKPLRNQAQFDERCREKTKEFLKLFLVQKPRPLSAGAVERLKEISFNQRKKCSLIEKDGLYVFIRWQKGNERNNALVTGQYGHVDQLMKSFESNHTIVDFSESEYKILSDCGIVEMAQKKFLVKISRCGNSSFNLFVDGTNADIAKAKEMLKSEVKEIQFENNFDFLSDDQKSFLCSSAKCETLESKFQEAFSRKNIRASLQLKGSPKLFYKPDSYNRSVEEIMQLIHFKQCLLSDDVDELLDTDAWDKFESFIKSSESLYCKRNKEEINLVGLSPDFENADQLLQEMLSQTDDKEVVVNMGKPQQQYISLFSCKIDSNFHLEHIDWNVVPDGIRLIGKLKLIKPAKEWLEDTVTALEVSTHEFEELWKIKHLNSKAGKQMLESIQNKSQCVIMPDSSTEQEKEKREATQLQPFPRQQYVPSRQSSKSVEVTLPGTNVTVRVVQNNIIEHKVDAIVNTSNEELELRSAGVSGSIMRKGGFQIQYEMNMIRQKFKDRRLYTGRAVTTGAGNLRNCRMIVHVAGPVWYQHPKHKAESLLKESTRSCLEQAELNGASSIAIPAISCGVFGGEPDLTAKLIVQTVVEYFKQNRKSNIKQIDLIELSNNQVIRAFKRELSSLTSNTSHKVPLRNNAPYQHAKVGKQYEGGCTVTVEQGNALLSDADVLINTAGPGFDLKLSKLSKMVVQEGGPDVQVQCHKYPEVKTQRFRIARCESLPFKFLAHLIVSNEIDYVSFDLLSIFKELEKLHLKSVALPAIGTGNASASVDYCVQLIKKGIDMFWQTNPVHLKIIKLVIYEERLLSRFQILSTEKSRAPILENSAWSKSLFPSVSSSFPSSSSVSSPTERKKILKLIICSKSKESNKKVRNQIDWKLESKYFDKVIREVPADNDIEQHLESYRKVHHVGIKQRDDQTIHVYGLQEDVRNACEKINNLIDLKRD